MAASKDAVIIIDMEDEDDEVDNDVKIQMEAMTDDEVDQGDTDTVIDFLDDKVAETVFNKEDEDHVPTDAAQDTEKEDKTGIGIDTSEERESAQETEGEDRTGIGTDGDQERDAEMEDQDEEEEEAGFAMQVAIELWEHLRDLLEDFTAHGFNHLFRRERDGTYNCGKIIMWALAIFVAYFASTYYTIASVQEANRNPIASTSGYFTVEVRYEAKVFNSNLRSYSILVR